MDIRVTRGLCAPLLACFTAAEAATLQVGPGKTFARIEAAVAAAAPGDTIRVFPLPNGSAYESVAVLVGTLYLVHNTIVTPFVSPVVDLSSAGASAVLIGNVVSDGGRQRHDQVLGDGRRGGASAEYIRGSHNWLAPGFGQRLGQTALRPADNTIAKRSQKLFVAPQNHDYRPRKPWPGIAAAGDADLLEGLPATPGASGGPPPLARQYVHPLGDAARPMLKRPDLGAHPVLAP